MTGERNLSCSSNKSNAFETRSKPPPPHLLLVHSKPPPHLLLVHSKPPPHLLVHSKPPPYLLLRVVQSRI